MTLKIGKGLRGTFRYTWYGHWKHIFDCVCWIEATSYEMLYFDWTVKKSYASDVTFQASEPTPLLRAHSVRSFSMTRPYSRWGGGAWSNSILQVLFGWMTPKHAYHNKSCPNIAWYCCCRLSYQPNLSPWPLPRTAVATLPWWRATSTMSRRTTKSLGVFGVFIVCFWVCTRVCQNRLKQHITSHH